jgi:hypothetical protein
MMAILFCVFLCPHSSDAFIDECSVCEPCIECQDLCECTGSSHEHEHCIDASCVYDFQSNETFDLVWTFDQIDWVHALLLLDEPKHPVCYPDIMAGISSHSFAIRQLDTIILRV